MRSNIVMVLVAALSLSVSATAFAQEKPLNEIHSGPICADLSAEARKIRREFWGPKSQEFRQKMVDFAKGQKSRELVNAAYRLIERRDDIVASYMKFSTVDHLNSSLVFARRRMPDEFGMFDEAVNEELSSEMYSLELFGVQGFERALTEANHAYLQAEGREYLKAAKASLATVQKCADMGREYDRRSAEEKRKRN